MSYELWAMSFKGALRGIFVIGAARLAASGGIKKSSRSDTGKKSHV